MPSKEAAPTKRVAVSVISTRTPWPGERRQARQLERLVGGYPTAYAKQDSGHRLLPQSAPAARGARRGTRI